MSQPTSKTEQIARDIEVISMAYSRSLNAMNNLIQMQIQDILDVSLEVRRELIEIDELETYLEEPEFDGIEVEEAEAADGEENAADGEDHAAKVAQATSKTIEDAKAEISAVADSSSAKAPNANDPVADLIAAACHGLSTAMVNTLATQNQLNQVAMAALTEGLALIYGYDDDEEIDLSID